MSSSSSWSLKMEMSLRGTISQKPCGREVGPSVDKWSKGEHDEDGGEQKPCKQCKVARCAAVRADRISGDCTLPLGQAPSKHKVSNSQPTLRKASIWPRMAVVMRCRATRFTYSRLLSLVTCER